MPDTDAKFTPSRLLDTLDGREFNDYASFQQAVLGLFNEHVRDFPAGYTYRDAIEWAVRRQRVRRDENRIVVLHHSTA